MSFKFIAGAAAVGALTALAVTAFIKKRKELEYDDFDDIDFDEMDDDYDCYGDVEVDVDIPKEDMMAAADSCSCCDDGTCDCQDEKKDTEDK